MLNVQLNYLDAFGRYGYRISGRGEARAKFYGHAHKIAQTRPLIATIVEFWATFWQQNVLYD